MDYPGVVSLIISAVLIFSIFAYIGKQGEANDKHNEFFPHKLIYAITWLNFPVALRKKAKQERSCFAFPFARHISKLIRPCEYNKLKVGGY